MKILKPISENGDFRRIGARAASEELEVENAWICPYCGRLGTRNYSQSGQITAIKCQEGHKWFALGVSQGARTAAMLALGIPLPERKARDDSGASSAARKAYLERLEKLSLNELVRANKLGDW